LLHHTQFNQRFKYLVLNDWLSVLHPPRTDMGVSVNPQTSTNHKSCSKTIWKGRLRDSQQECCDSLGSMSLSHSRILAHTHNLSPPFIPLYLSNSQSLSLGLSLALSLSLSVCLSVSPPPPPPSLSLSIYLTVCL
jgi:hypothetical protein